MDVDIDNDELTEMGSICRIHEIPRYLSLLPMWGEQTQIPQQWTMQ